MHHISSDGFSMNLIIDQLNNFYLGENDKQVSTITYGDYAEYTKTDEFEHKLQRQEEYWKKNFLIIVNLIGYNILNNAI